MLCYGVPVGYGAAAPCVPPLPYVCPRSPTDPSADPTELLCTPIWAGWLDKMAPQG